MPVINPSALPSGNLKGEHHGATISVILDHSPPGHGPRLHKHPYDETWVVIAGNLTFQAGDQQLEGGPGDIVIIPPEAPHKFINHGPTPANLVVSVQARWGKVQQRGQGNTTDAPRRRSFAG